MHAISFVGSERVARYVYGEAARHGKRVQAAGGAKNHMVVMPDADLDHTIPGVLNSAFGNAGERCLAGSVTVAVGEVGRELLERLEVETRALKVGPGDQPGVDVGPLIREDHRRAVKDYIRRGVEEGARLLVGGQELDLPGYFLTPAILDGVHMPMTVARDEIFGPVLAVSYARDLGDAIAQANAGRYGNMATIFTSSGASAREFRDRVEAGMVGVNVGVAQPFAFYPFSGWRASFFGDLHLHGQDGIEFFTRKKMAITRW